MIELKNISLKMREKIILKDISFRVQKSSTTVIVGPSGAGKSTILKIIAGLMEPDSGEIKYNGKNIHRLTVNEYQLFRRRIGLVFQSNALFDSLSVNDNILYFIPERKRKTKKELKEISDRLLNFVNMEGTSDLFPEELSGGMKKRIAIARALANNPEIILFDEPTTGLDPINSSTIIDLIIKLKRHGTTSIVVSHVMNDIVELADRILFINNGSKVESGSIEEIIKSEEPFVKSFFTELIKYKLN